MSGLNIWFPGKYEYKMEVHNDGISYDKCFFLIISKWNGWNNRRRMELELVWFWIFSCNKWCRWTASGLVVGALGGTVTLPGVGTVGGAGAGSLVGLAGGVAWGAGSYAAGQLYQGICGWFIS